MNAPPDSASRQGRARPALRLIKTQDLRLEQWLDVRGTGIGSSDAAAAVGLNTYCSALELFPINSGQDADLDKVDPNDDSSPMFWGSILEDIEAAVYTRRTGDKVRRINAVLQHPQHSWMLANIDREVIGSNDVQILECNAAGMNGKGGAFRLDCRKPVSGPTELVAAWFAAASSRPATY